MNPLETKLTAFDPDADRIMRDEIRRNEETVNLIASGTARPSLP